ncbi:RNA polymerase sigma-70 factor [Pedobacter sp. KBW06]|uniref:RNA polymerase sigma factor n=1 Tax=Pedobacter sp. KBW06 TaxID=2153359 RepID=UPI000F5ACDAC|nr:RNA polymerase sigma-70 factor [Pedobacter sp. KBW06]RQO65931.1 RNA polymerase sigma-70 factor [Pedobacter sp. KBW06]
MAGELLEDLNESERITQLKEGNKRAFEDLYNRYKYRIAGNLLKLLKSEELAEEMLQDLFMRIWDNRSSLDPEKSFRAYLFRIAENMVVDYYRKIARDRKAFDKMMSSGSEYYSHIEETIFSKERILLLHGAINLLPPQRKHVFILCKLEGKSYKEVSELLGISPSTINDHLLKANRFLKQYLNPTLPVVVSMLAGAIVVGI